MKRKQNELDEEDRDNSEDSYFSKIATMMYTFGDAKEPLEESVELMYVILKEQMILLLKEAAQAAILRGSKKISHEEILFVMRKNTAVLRQLLQYLQVLDTKQWLKNGIILNEDDKSIDDMTIDLKRVKMCMKFFASIEDCGEFTSLLKDNTLTLPERARKRLKERLAMIECMKQNEYQEFSEALKVSFCEKKGEFIKWLLKEEIKKFHLTELALIIIGFLARETIAEIISKALAIKKEKLKAVQNCWTCASKIDLFEASCNYVLMRLKNIKQDKVNDLEHLTNISEKEMQVILCESENFSNALSEETESKTDISSDETSSDESDINESADKKLIEGNSESVINYKQIYEENPSELDVIDSHDEKPFEDDSNEKLMDSYLPYAIDFNDEKFCTKDVNDKLSSPDNESCYHSKDEISIRDLNEESASPLDIGVSKDTSKSPPSSVSEFFVVEDSNSGNLSSGVNEDISCNDEKFFTKDVNDKLSSPDNESCHHSKDEISFRDPYNPYNPPIEDVSETASSVASEDHSSVDNCLEASKEEFLNRKPITPEEIREAFAQFNNPSPLVYFFSNYPVFPKKKFILAGSFEDV